MAPEQIIHGAFVDGRADIWSLGVVLHELVCGQLPFPLDTPERMLDAICTKAPIPLRRVRPEMPAAIERIVLRCLARNPDDRYASVADLAEELHPFRPIRDVMKSSGEIETAHAYTDPRRQAPTVVVAPKKSRRPIFVGAGLAILALSGVGLIVAARGGTTSAHAVATEPPPPATASTADIATPPSSAAAPPPNAPPEPAADSPPAPPPSTHAKSIRPKPKAAPRAVSKPASTSSNDRSTMFGERK